MRKSKEKLLKHYKYFEPNLFKYYNYVADGGQVTPDEETYHQIHGLTYELRDADPLRVLITVGTPKETVLKLLDELMSCIKKDGDWQNNGIKELNTINKLKVAEGVLEKMIEDDYTSDDIEFLLGALKSIRDSKKQTKGEGHPF